MMRRKMKNESGCTYVRAEVPYLRRRHCLFRLRHGDFRDQIKLASQIKRGRRQSKDTRSKSIDAIERKQHRRCGDENFSGFVKVLALKFNRTHLYRLVQLRLTWFQLISANSQQPTGFPPLWRPYATDHVHASLSPGGAWGQQVDWRYLANE